MRILVKPQSAVAGAKDLVYYDPWGIRGLEWKRPRRASGGDGAIQDVTRPPYTDYGDNRQPPQWTSGGGTAGRVTVTAFLLRGTKINVYQGLFSNDRPGGKRYREKGLRLVC